MEGFTAFCVWFLAFCAVVELSWKGWNKYKEIKPKVSETKDKDLEEEKKNKD
tara:strand:+ start:1020 stop:1175 length:156 start_codon:yes stop_codon:yes gene_type:complete